ncbi:MAG: DUF2937 family protein [Hyphomicrobiales bacterium]
MFGKLVVIVMGFVGAALFCQAPEIATQYQQRLGGAIDELRTVIERFDADVAKNGLDRTSALQLYNKSPEKFLHDRGASMSVAIERFDALRTQEAAFKTTSDLNKPIYVFREADQKVLKGVLDDYMVGLPATSSGAVYGSFGALLGLLFGGLLLKLSGLDTRRSRRRA